MSVDIHAPSIERLKATLAVRGLSQRVHAQVGDMAHLELPPESCDPVWSEGALYNIGIGNALRGDAAAPGILADGAVTNSGRIAASDAATGGGDAGSYGILTSGSGINNTGDLTAASQGNYAEAFGLYMGPGTAFNSGNIAATAQAALDALASGIYIAATVDARVSGITSGYERPPASAAGNSRRTRDRGRTCTTWGSRA